MEFLGLQLMAGVLGACIGSFLNVVVYRVPAGLSVLYPPSRCPHCLRQLAPRDNLPVLGWFLLRGQCRYCHAPIAWRYPAVEALTALVFWAIALQFGQTVPLVVLPFYGAFAAWLMALALIDLDTLTLPESLTRSGLVLGIAYRVIAGTTAGATAAALLTGVVGMVVGIWVLDVFRLGGSMALQKEAMGAGDPKLAAMMGMWLGWEQILLTLFLASFLGTLAGVALMLRQKQSQPYPFGPFLAIAGLISLLAGPQILTTYSGWLGLTF